MNENDQYRVYGVENNFFGQDVLLLEDKHWSIDNAMSHESGCVLLQIEAPITARFANEETIETPSRVMGDVEASTARFVSREAAEAYHATKGFDFLCCTPTIVALMAEGIHVEIEVKIPFRDTIPVLNFEMGNGPY
mmetsp:Transcript_7805/g.12952  ORF Transcript_7805/g.12952 Transcript_7805/m.12952 type:complete len:136 (-) Transcript_7805:254-661(-)